MTMEARELLSIEMALPLPLTRIVVLLHLVMRMDWTMVASISRGSGWSSKFSWKISR